MGFIKCQRAVILSARDGPSCNLFTLFAVEYPEFGSPVEVHKNSRPGLLEGDPAGTSVRLDFSDLFVARRIEDRQRAGISIAQPGVEVFPIRIVAHLVCVGAKRKAGDELEGVPAKYLASAVGAVRYKKRVEFSGIEGALGFALPGDAENPFARHEIDRFYSVLSIAVRGNE